MHSMVASCFAKCSRAISASYCACMLIQNLSLSPSAREPQCSVGAKAALAVHDLVDAPRRHVDRFGDPRPRIVAPPFCLEQSAAPQGFTVFPWASVVEGPSHPARPSHAPRGSTAGRKSRTPEHLGSAVAAAPPQRQAVAGPCTRTLAAVVGDATLPVVAAERLGVRGRYG
jgi:hypothetical protein